jgi:hypothetical protein
VWVRARLPLSVVSDSRQLGKCQNPLAFSFPNRGFNSFPIPSEKEEAGSFSRFNPFQNLAAGVATKVRALSSSPYFFPVTVLARAIKSGFPPSSLAGSGSNLMEAAGFGMP